MRVTKLTFTVTVSAILLVSAGIFIYVQAARRTLLKNTSNTVQQECFEKASVFDQTFRYAQSSIKLVATSLTDDASPVDMNSCDVLNHYKDYTPFGTIDFVDKDGINHVNAIPGITQMVAKKAPYYTEGISGKSGVFIDYEPKVGKHPIVVFYTPYVHNNQISGVLNGAIISNKSIKPMLQKTAYGHPVVFVLLDKDMNVISSASEDIPEGICFKRYADNAFISEIINHIDEKDETAFTFKEEGKTGICCVSHIESVDWNLVAIVLPKALTESVKELTARNYYLIGFVVFILLVYLCIRFYLHDKILKQHEHEKYMETLIESQSTQISMLSSFSGIYYSAHLIDMKSDTMVEINSAPELRKIIDTSRSVCEQLQGGMRFVATPEYVDEMVAFTNLDTVGKRLKEKKIISTEFLSNMHGWARASFIPVERDDENIPFKVLFVTQIIDDEKRHEQNLINSAYNDELTGLYNRRAYENDLNAFRNSVLDTNFVYVSFDVNGLKNVNDNLGHEAGDELIRGAADCLVKCFGSYGKVYRTGGDEFQAIINVSKDVLDDVKVIFEKTVDSWAGRLVPELKISAGYVLFAENTSLSISEMTKLADQRMYKDKSRFYTAKGVDRRGQQAAFAVLCQSYTKILKVDLEKDQYTILQMDESEKDSLKGFSEQLSVWLHNFAMSGQVHQDDVEEYLRKTDIGYIKSFFNNGNRNLSLQYRRKIGGEFHNVMMELCPAKEYSLENQTIYLFVKNVDKA